MRVEHSSNVMRGDEDNKRLCVRIRYVKEMREIPIKVLLLQTSINASRHTKHIKMKLQ